MRTWTRRAALSGAGAFALAGAAQAQSFEDTVRGVLSANAGATQTGLPRGVSATDAQSGLKEALRLGAIAAVTRVGRLDGFWADGTIRIPLPRSLAQVQRGLQPLGLSAPLDDLQLRINRAAETAAPRARTLFVNAIRAMTIEDVVGVLRGGDTAATDLLRARTGPDLTAAFRPPVDEALAASGAFTALDSVAARYGAQAALGDRPRTMLATFAVERALDGVFHYVAQEERAIRADPAKRTTALLRRVFGG